MTLKETNLTTHQLRAVVLITKLGSFVAAANALGISQSALSRMIQLTEETLNIALFSRSTRRVELTPAGREFIGMAERVLNDVDLTMENMVSLSELRRGQVIVATLQSIAQGTLADAVAQYVGAFAAISVQIREGVQSAIEADVLSGVADFGVCATEELDQSLIAEPLGQEPLHLVMREDHPLSRHKKVTLKMLKDTPLVSLPGGSKTRGLVDLAAAAAGITLQYRILAGNLATVLALVERGAGLAIVPSSILRSSTNAGLRARPFVDANMSRAVGVVRLGSRALTPAAAELVSVVKAKVRF